MLNLSEIQCDNENDYVTPDETCLPCYPYSVVNDERTGCVEPACEANELIEFDGSCI